MCLPRFKVPLRLVTTSRKCRKHPRRTLLFVLMTVFWLHLLNCALHMSQESFLVVVLNHVAVSSPQSCDPKTDFQVHPQMDPRLGLEVGADGYLVPNYVHYVWYVKESKDFSFLNMLSVLSAHKYIKPSVIYLYCNIEPLGENWDRVKQEVPELKVILRNPVTCIYGNPVSNPIYGPSSSDLERVTSLMEKGGIYLDLDVLVVRSFDPLRQYACTLGMESEDKVNSGVLVSHKNSPFLRLWLEHYLVNYKVWMWNYNAGWVPAYLAKRYPEYIHIERFSLQRPNGDEINKIWGDEEYDWSQNYAIHLLFRTWKSKNFFFVGEPDEEYVRKKNNTFSQLARRILSIKLHS